MRRVGLAILGIVAFAAAVLGGSATWADDGRPAFPVAKGGHCVDDIPVMRRNHFAFLYHQRDETLRLGIRGGKYSLKECVNCHAATGPDGKAIPVNAPGQFCQSCHEYAAVSIDCFSCHATTPDSAGAGKTAAR
ncbi:MAG: Hdr-like menaquinol oxidoreductase cytochrome c subunit [Magnetospirillum sp.]|nr:Hdr-like menaquinol oxidoreductase cytochrome c subunit [Magnetospirillum sp.]